ncbi:fumarylacetoacetate hydrolase family protein [Escherichia fergusonii]|uniref:fumarylacetoacetate hydrolase family protein n=1 Tax=Escherichia fergusonii TaxID=564 RepID=UPI002FFBD8F2
MKLVSFTHNNAHRYGILQDSGVTDLTLHFPQYPTLRSFLEVLENIPPSPLTTLEINYPLDDITFLPLIPDPQKILCVGMNYQEKRLEFDEEDPAPTLFVRFPDSQCGHMGDIIKPAASQEFDYEGELALVIGKGGRNISADNALQHIAGYSCYMDGSARDWQHAWFTAGKNWPSTGGFGPWLVTRDEIKDPNTLCIKTRLNGVEVQNENTINMIHSVPELIAYISTFCQLVPGDVILTGSPGGVGKKRTPPLFLKDGDTIEVEIEKIGCLYNRIIDEIPENIAV